MYSRRGHHLIGKVVNRTMRHPLESIMMQIQTLKMHKHQSMKPIPMPTLIHPMFLGMISTLQRKQLQKRILMKLLR